LRGQASTLQDKQTCLKIIGLSLMKESEVDLSLIQSVAALALVSPNEYEELMKQITNCRQSDKQVLCVCAVCCVLCVVVRDVCCLMQCVLCCMM